MLLQDWLSYAIFLESLVVETFEGYFMFYEEALPLWLFDLLTDQQTSFVSYIFLCFGARLQEAKDEVEPSQKKRVQGYKTIPFMGGLYVNEVFVLCFPL